MLSYSTILQGHTTTEEAAKEWAQGFDFSQDEVEENSYSHSRYIDTINNIEIHYCYGADYYFFCDAATEDKKIKDFKEGIEGIEFLRNAVQWFNYRDEHLNAEKTPKQLLNEYLEEVNHG
ncbi:hypothetical protein Phi4:1_gp128 [Cellulophaga phage phi4:1]|uniref:Uncharacterized protein n=5 Tax=Lightbulbvirus TaxID=1918522 RepID=A0A0S2MWN8_9CAUD|nr:hypothetical protein Phi4:1_gp128 [Cellulophaga phage phi4:1]YP_008241627.1 hypothetical protein Phi17:2_gp132 [Cellulophaga phage phi17:2]ALO80137.1 hypothetical protein Phi4113_128 [Cellulophaga phage phi4:1_13]ALO80334.1 hypothetical protein Phi4118_128 [Cellulophaga phage phi4:1_18]ALO80535.1 hypothetical protein Phi17218_132 [Cellulophaga phage phi17:2_18]AGO47665.1 hypothetical protein Phi17:2_gp132 [Cellulophaga phage phi17:2]AGO49541.1 hypothetical protein Phi4:1_gp128 [Cellulophag